MKIIKDDIVKILTGKDSGKEGKVLRVLPKEKKVLVEGINIFKKHLRKMSDKMEGRIIEINKPVNISNVGLICPKCKKTTRVGFKIENDIKNRVCKKCQEVIS